MATIITPQDFEHERLLSRSPRHYSEVLPDLRVVYSGGCELNPVVLQTPEISWPTGSPMGLMIHEGTLRPDDDPYIVTLITRPEIQRKIGIPYIINNRRAHESAEVRDAVRNLRRYETTLTGNPLWANLSLVRYVTEFCPMNAVKMALENSGDALDLNVADFHKWLWPEVVRYFKLLLDKRARKDSKLKCNLCRQPCQEGICPNGHENFYFSEEGFWRDKVSSQDDDRLIIEVEDPTIQDPERKILFGEMLSKLKPLDRRRMNLWAQGFTSKERARENRTRPSSEKQAIHRNLTYLKKI
ncbi:hypothetical protein MYX84_00795 [Acidobacteria bacterium AH-259-O06]|nr:hypothetical protein [Acidobacteria bacterium AH-259-O06]